MTLKKGAYNTTVVKRNNKTKYRKRSNGEMHNSLRVLKKKMIIQVSTK